MSALTYVDFKPVSDTDAKLKEKFLSEAKGLGLGQLIKSCKNSIRLAFHQAIGLDNVYLIMIVGNNDGILIKLAKERNFPRGFPVLWIPGIRMQYFGFYPKFSNDERQTADDLSEFDNVVSLSFFKKWSGFLAQVLFFQINGCAYWTITSKNSANSNSTYISDAKRLFTKYISDGVAIDMIEKNLHMCAEVMSKNDQTHGSPVLQEMPIVTAIGSGHDYDLTRPLEEHPAEDFVNFYTNEQLVKFCMVNGLPCDSCVMVDGATAAKKFMTELSLQRDFMTDKKLEQLLSQFMDCIYLVPGTVTHKEILGDCLEGLVIRLRTSGGGTTTKKYKFPGYTIRTMLLRTQFDDFIFSHELIQRAKEFIDGWCISAAGKEHWYRFALKCFLVRRKFVPTDSLISSHIRIAEQVMQKDSLDTTEVKFMRKLQLLTNGTVIICVGPIGSGKSSFANELSTKDPTFVSIDGDGLDLGQDITMILGKERNDYSRWKVLEALMLGKIPILSTGGGILFSLGKDQVFTLRKQIATSLGVICRIIVCITGDFTGITALSKDYDPTNSYNDLDTVKKVVRRRVETGQWKLDPKFQNKQTKAAAAASTDDTALENFAAFIAKKSSDNCKFAKQLIAAADFVYGYPSITAENYGIQKTFSCAPLLANIIPSRGVAVGKFSQIRLLALINNETDGKAGQAGHITWKYDSIGNIHYTMTDFNNLASSYPKFVNGKYYTLISTNGRTTYTFVMPEKAIHDDGSTHITVDCGSHPPKETGTIIRAMNGGQTSLSLPQHDGRMVEYDLTKISFEPCQIQMLGAFGI